MFNQYNIHRISSEEEIAIVQFISGKSYSGHFVDEKLETKMSIREQLDQGVLIFLIVDDNSKPLGTFRLQLLKDNYIFIKGIAILKNARSYNLTKIIWQYILDFARNLKIESIIVSTFRYNQRLINLYKHLGFKFLKYEIIPDNFYERSFYKYDLNR